MNIESFYTGFMISQWPLLNELSICYEAYKDGMGGYSYWKWIIEGV